MILGAWLNLHVTGDTAALIGAVSDRVGEWFVKVTLVVLVIGTLAVNALNIYGSYMSSLSIATSLFPRVRHGMRLRLSFIIPAAAVATYVSFLYKDNLLSSFQTFLSLTLIVIIRRRAGTARSARPDDEPLPRRLGPAAHPDRADPGVRGRRDVPWGPTRANGRRGRRSPIPST